jgi:hypothetical protein
MDKKAREMFEYKIKVIERMIAEEEGKPMDGRYGVRLHHPERKSLDIMLGVDALLVLSEHYRELLHDKRVPTSEDGVEKRIKRGLENYRENKLADAAANLQVAGNKILEIIDERFKESQHEH